jgi:hypothetical protein
MKGDFKTNAFLRWPVEIVIAASEKKMTDVENMLWLKSPLSPLFQRGGKKRKTAGESPHGE